MSWGCNFFTTRGIDIAFVFRPSSMPWNAFACFIHIIAQQRHMGRVQILHLKLCNFCMFQSQRYFVEQANVAFHFTHIILQNFSPLPITSRIGQRPTPVKLILGIKYGHAPMHKCLHIHIFHKVYWKKKKNSKLIVHKKIWDLPSKVMSHFWYENVASCMFLNQEIITWY